MPDSRTLNYGVGFCPVCGRGNLALTRDGMLHPHNVMPWIRRKCSNRQAHLTPREPDKGDSPVKAGLSLPAHLSV